MCKFQDLSTVLWQEQGNLTVDDFKNNFWLKNISVLSVNKSSKKSAAIGVQWVLSK